MSPLTIVRVFSICVGDTYPGFLTDRDGLNEPILVCESSRNLGLGIWDSVRVDLGLGIWESNGFDLGLGIWENIGVDLGLGILLHIKDYGLLVSMTSDLSRRKFWKDDRIRCNTILRIAYES